MTPVHQAKTLCQASGMIENAIPTATILAAYTYQDEREIAGLHTLADHLAGRLHRLVIPCSLDQPDRQLVESISYAVRQGVVKIAVLPLFMTPAAYHGNAVAEAITLASRRWPFLQFHLTPPLGWQTWVEIIGATALEAYKKLSAGHAKDETAVILVGRGSSNPDENSDLAKLAHLFLEANGFGWVNIAFVQGVVPDISEGLRRSKSLGAKQIVIVPFELFIGETLARISWIATNDGAHSHAFSADFLDCCWLTAPLGLRPELLDVLVEANNVALTDRSLLPVSWEEVLEQMTAELASHNKPGFNQPPPDEDDFIQLSQKIDAILPARYKGRADEISSAPMAAAELVYDEVGEVAWDQVFGVDDPDNPFCELALAGGPSHRGTLLEAATADECQAELGKYSAVVSEIERYIVMPGQATAYKIGMMKILEVREKAKQALGDKFDLRDFHDVVLKNGAVPLDILERLIDSYIAEKLAVSHS